MAVEYKLLEPLAVGRRVVRNRVVMPAMETRLNSPDGSPTQLLIDYYEARARGGAGMVVVENTFIDPYESRSSIASSGLFSDHQIPMKAYLAEAIKRHGALALIQLSHGGRQANPQATGMECVAPSAVPSEAVGRMPRELTVSEIERIENRFADAAVRAKNAGFDGVELHGAHGYLISEFLSPYSNRRTDAYGGSFENRSRMPREVIEKVRAAVGADFIIGFKINADEWLGSAGLPPMEAREFVRSVQEMIDYVCCSAGTYETMSACQICSEYVPAGLLLPLAAEMKRVVDIPVMAIGSLDARLGEEALARGQADLIAMGRAHIADPCIVAKLSDGGPDDIRPCCRGNDGCVSGFEIGYPIRCEMNPAVGRERLYGITPAQVPRRVMVIGGGPAGMEFARVADLLGHDVALLEKAGWLGGHLYEGAVPSFKEGTRGALIWLVKQLRKSGVKMSLGVDATPADVEKYRPDVLAIATGSKYASPDFAGADLAASAGEVLLGDKAADALGGRVVVIGGGRSGVDVAMYLAEKGGHDVAIVERLTELAPEMEKGAREAMLRRLAADKVKVLLGAEVVGIRERGAGQIAFGAAGTGQAGSAGAAPAMEVHIKGQGGNENIIVCNTAVNATGLVADRDEAAKFAGLAAKTITLGDANSARGIRSCFEDAWSAAFGI
ncbi:MAG: NAD(P)/FAD-dependent oxidoreductase [Clostridiales Family XIII bacterium]|jgi:2,4-dienoyl-CoA reductase-like NADH-dependent reductase (Old Yellow Enzyme family)|nr:NAD(P)/FAD-dependent oxidoreductase [Clostridiales Family XIII bacterium]